MRRAGPGLPATLVVLVLTACDTGPARVVQVDAAGGAGPVNTRGSNAELDASAAPADEAEAQALATGRAVPCPDDPDIGFVGPWYAFSDADTVEIEGRCDTCGSPSTLSRASGAPASAWCPVTVTGRLDATCDAPFAGMGVRFDMVDRRGMGHLVLATQGDGNRYRLDFVDLYQEARLDGSCDDEDGNHPGTFFTCGDGSGGWREVAIPLDDLSQRPGWGAPHDLQLRDLRKMNVVFDGFGARDPTVAGAAPRAHDFRCSVAILRWVPRVAEATVASDAPEPPAATDAPL